MATLKDAELRPKFL